MMKILIIGDPHFMINNVIQTDQLYSETVRILDEHKPNVVVVLGDTLHTHEKISISPLVRATSFLSMIKNKVDKLIILIGNHDRINNQDFLSDNHPFIALKDWDKTIIVDKVKMIEINKFKFICVPYVFPGKFEEALLTEGYSLLNDSLKNINFIFAHQEFRGAIFGEKGDIYPLTAPFCISGHIHEYRVLQENVLYPGTPYQTNHGESLNKSISLLTINEDNSFNIEKIKLNILYKINVKLTAEEFIDYIPPSSPKNVIIKLIISGDPKKIRNIMKIGKIASMLQSEMIKVSIQDTTDTPLISHEMSTVISFHEKLKEVIEREPNEIKNEFLNLFS